MVPYTHVCIVRDQDAGDNSLGKLSSFYDLRPSAQRSHLMRKLNFTTISRATLNKYGTLKWRFVSAPAPCKSASFTSDRKELKFHSEENLRSLYFHGPIDACTNSYCGGCAEDLGGGGGGGGVYIRGVYISRVECRRYDATSPRQRY
jgi:hypothetical protein